jgi:hypothetical protein
MPVSDRCTQTGCYLLEIPHLPGSHRGGIYKAACGKMEQHLKEVLEMVKVVNGDKINEYSVQIILLFNEYRLK